MLQRVRYSDRPDQNDPRDWQDDPADDYGRVGRVDPVDRYYDDDAPRGRRRKKRSVAGRVLLTLLIAIVLAGSAAAFLVVARGGNLETVIARAKALVPAGSRDGPAADPATAANQTAAEPAAPPQAEQAVAEPAARPAIPPVEGLVILIRTAIVALHQANTAGNYSVLRDIAAPDFQQANSPADLSVTFAKLREIKVDLDRIVTVNPRLNADPTIDDRGILRLAGFFPAGAEQVDFDLLFQAAGGRWRLFGIGVAPSATPAAPPTEAAPAVPSSTAVPDPATLVTLIRGTVIALNQADLTGNYSVLRDIAAPGFRQANDLAKLADVFGDLRARKLDLSPVAVIDPKLFKPPTIDQGGFLRLTGFFPSRPEQVNFDMAFQFDAGDWRLFGIGLNTSVEVADDTVAAASVSEAPAANAGGAANEPQVTTAVAPAGPPPVPRLRPR